MAYTVMADVGRQPDYLGRACRLGQIVMTYIVMAYTVVADMGMVYTGMTYTVTT